MLTPNLLTFVDSEILAFMRTYRQTDRPTDGHEYITLSSRKRSLLLVSYIPTNTIYHFSLGVTGVYINGRITLA